MNTNKVYLFLFVMILGFLSIASTNIQDEGKKKNPELTKFSHALHVEDIDCQECHTEVANSESLSNKLFPTHEICAYCHDVEDDENCTTCHYEDVYEPLVLDNRGLMFNHKIHVEQNGLECVHCHGQMNNEVEANIVFNPPMETCAACHSDQGVATIACEACHISTANLIPDNHLVNDFKLRHKFLVDTNDNCEMCHSESFCESCHEATSELGVANTKDDFYTPYSPHRFTDRKNMQNLERRHGLNYRFTHGIDAKGKESTCMTCHETETFCVECHNSTGDGDFAMEGFVPVSHKAPDFIILGVGGGGGEHAKLARRDIESCSSCHDVEGADPSCILCHVDPDGIKGTNPKTHQIGFMRDNQGDWHSDFNSLCYNCHTDANANPNGIKGNGFCGYCHTQ